MRLAILAHALRHVVDLERKLILRLNLRLEGADLRNERAQPLDFTLVLRADDLGEDLTEHFVKECASIRRVST